MRVADVIGVMDAWAPPGLAYDWDRSGLATGSPDQKVTSVLTCLTITQAALAAARRHKANMIVSHHPLVWSALKSLRTDRAPERLVLDAAKAGLACYSAHTNLDVVSDGVNRILADRLSLRDTEMLFPTPKGDLVKLVTFVPLPYLDLVRNALAEAGAGEIGNYSYCSFTSPGTGSFQPSPEASPFSGEKEKLNLEPEQRLEMVVELARSVSVLAALHSAHPYETPAYDLYPLENENLNVGLGMRGRLDKAITLRTFARRVSEALEIEHVRVSGDLKSKVANIAVMGGAGGGSASGVPDDVDVFVTGDVKYHDAVDAAERSLAIIDAGHHGTEKWIVPAITDRLKSKLKGVTVRSYMEPDPFAIVTQ